MQRVFRCQVLSKFGLKIQTGAWNQNRGNVHTHRHNRKMIFFVCQNVKIRRKQELEIFHITKTSVTLTIV